MPNYGDNTEQTIDSCNNVGGPKNNYAEGKKIKSQMLHIM